MPRWPSVFETLRESGIEVLTDVPPRAVGGGDAGAAWRLEARAGPLFLKTSAAQDFEQLSAEAEGLAALAEPALLRVPRVLALAQTAGDALLALEWLPLERPDRRIEEAFGTALARLHMRTSERFGWHRDNTIGRTPQRNAEDDDWLRFFRVQRLEFQLDLALKNGFRGELQEAGRRMLACLDRLFDDHEPPASLLHGDLWGGNRAAVDGEPAVFDPAVYYGDRETDLAMTRLFGGFGAAFYRAYETAWPLPRGFRRREPVYQLYHLLNHLNLFGAAYLDRVLATVRRVRDSAR